jgi:hypothetical protein
LEHNRRKKESQQQRENGEISAEEISGFYRLTWQDQSNPSSIDLQGRTQELRPVWTGTGLDWFLAGGRDVHCAQIASQYRLLGSENVELI